MISVEHMQELIDKFDSGELDIRDIIEQSYFGGRAEAIDEFADMLKAFIDDNGMEEDGEQFAIFSKRYIDIFAKGLKEQANE